VIYSTVVVSIVQRCWSIDDKDIPFEDFKSTKVINVEKKVVKELLLLGHDRV
jgi:hypothetical protein